MKFRKAFLVLFISLVSIIVSCDSGGSKKIKIGFDSFDFGEIALRAKDSVQLAIENASSKIYSIDNFRLSGTNAADYSLIGAGSYLLQPKEIKQITIEFEPTTAGVRIALLEFDSNAQSKSFMVNLTGYGKETPEFEIDFTSHDYGRAYIGFPIDFTFEISNKGTGDLTISQFSITGPNAGDFTITAGSTIPVTVHSEYSHPADFKHQFTVEFSPLVAGQSSATLEITHDAVGSPSSVTLEGLGEDPFADLTVDPTTYKYNGVAVGDDDDHEFEIESTGILDLDISGIEIVAGTSTEFSIQSVDNDGTPVTSAPYACTVLVGKICTVTVRFSPTIKGQGKTSTLKITHNAATSPTDVSLEGATGFPVMINECDMKASDYVEIYNSGSSQVDLSGWTLSIWYTRSAGNICCGTYNFPPGSNIGPGAVQICAESSGAGDYQLGFNIMWIGGDGGETILKDNNSSGVDYMFFNMNTPEHIPSNLSWNGSAVPDRGEGNHYRNSNNNTLSASDWSFRTTSIDKGSKNPGQ